MKIWDSKLSKLALLIALTCIPVTAARANATANTTNQQGSSATNSHTSQLVEPAVLVLVGAALLAGAVAVRKLTPNPQMKIDGGSGHSSLS
jgi:hypothetical protein